MCKVPLSTAKTIIKNRQKKMSHLSSITSKDLMHIYQSLKKTSGRPNFKNVEKLLSETRSISKDKKTPPILAVIIETRKHPLLEFVVLQLISKTNLPVQIFHGIENESFIQSTAIKDFVKCDKVFLSKLNTDSLNASDYNGILLSCKFWNLLNGRGKILIFQTDSILCNKSPYNLYTFLDFDYIGSTWARKRPVGITIDGGNGGLSLRSWEKSLQCLEQFPPSFWPGGEDGYFGFHLELMGAKVGKEVDCAKFSTHRYFHYKSFGAHKISVLDKKDKDAFIQYCPEAKKIL